jgi:hypothetical protein
MKRSEISFFVGFFITATLAVISMFAGSIKVVRAMFWQCSMVQRACPPKELCEGTPVDAVMGTICIMLSVPVYSLLTYAVLWFVAKKRRPGHADV